MKKIGVEKGLANVASHLIRNGYTVEMLSGSIDDNMNKLPGYDCIVTSGLNTDMMGVSDTATKAPVINAKGLSPTEVMDRISSIQG